MKSRFHSSFKDGFFPREQPSRTIKFVTKKQERSAHHKTVVLKDSSLPDQQPFMINEEDDRTDAIASHPPQVLPLDDSDEEEETPRKDISCCSKSTSKMKGCLKAASIG